MCQKKLETVGTNKIILKYPYNLTEKKIRERKMTVIGSMSYTRMVWQFHISCV